MTDLLGGRVNIAGRSDHPPVVDGVLLSRTGQVHRNRGLITECGHALPPLRVAVSDLQALVHKLTVCTVCYPSANAHKGRRAQ